MGRLLAACLALLLAACGGGPDADTLRKDVEQRLAQSLPPGIVTVASLARRGSQSDTRAPEGETRRIVYYTAELRLAADYDFGAWDSPGVSGLVSALGAGPKGLSGITSGGNKAGDVLRAQGNALYREEKGGWVAVSGGGYRPGAAPAYATNKPPNRVATLLADVRKVVDSVPKETAPAHMAVIEEELAAAHAAIRARLARQSEGYAIAAGPEHGQYLRFARALAAVPKARVVSLVTRGGEENIRMLREGKVAAALAQGDAALAAYEGTGSFAGEGPYAALRAIGSLYPEPVHVIVRGDAAIRKVADLRGKRVAIGVPGSASRTTVLRVLEAHGLGVNDIVPVEVGLGDALAALRGKEVEAVVQVIGVPADSVRDALAGAGLRLVGLEPAAIAKLTQSSPVYFAHTIPAGAYPAQKEDVRTIATAAVLLAGGDLSDSEIATLTRAVYDPRQDFAARGSAQGAQVSARSARQGLPVPQNAAAARALDAIQKR